MLAVLGLYETQLNQVASQRGNMTEQCKDVQKDFICSMFVPECDTDGLTWTQPFQFWYMGLSCKCLCERSQRACGLGVTDCAD
jgi:hypothetical protein